jgi:hypothetical protein
LLLGDQLSHSAKETLRNYLAGAVLAAQDARTMSAALIGLAALDHPVLGDLHYAKEHFGEIKNADGVAKLYLATAFAAVGDRENALSLYGEAADEYRREENGETFFAGKTSEDTLEITYAALMCASLTQPAEAAALMEYVSSRTSAYETYALENAIFACAYAPDAYVPKAVTYVLDGQSYTVELSGRCPVSVTLHRDQYAAFRIAEVSEGVAVRALYWGSPEAASAATAKNVTVKNYVLKGEYLAWYSENLTLIGCRIEGTQPFCYCRNLTLIDCEMISCDLAFERSTVQAQVKGHIDSVKNPISGRISSDSIGDVILDLPSECVIETP